MKNKETDNFRKHTSKNIAQQYFINKFYQKMLEMIRPLGPVDILDAGCGEGFTLNKLNKAGIGRNLTGLDLSTDALKTGHKLFPQLLLKPGNIYDMLYKDAFDLVICSEVLEHLEKPEEALKNISNATRKYIFISVPYEPWFRLVNFLRGKNTGKFGNDPEHINHWGINGISGLLLKQSLKIHSIKVSFPWILLLAEK